MSPRLHQHLLMSRQLITCNKACRDKIKKLSGVLLYSILHTFEQAIKNDRETLLLKVEQYLANPKLRIKYKFKFAESHKEVHGITMRKRQIKEALKLVHRKLFVRELKLWCLSNGQAKLQKIMQILDSSAKRYINLQ